MRLVRRTNKCWAFLASVVPAKRTMNKVLILVNTKKEAFSVKFIAENDVRTYVYYIVTQILHPLVVRTYIDTWVADTKTTQSQALSYYMNQYSTISNIMPLCIRRCPVYDG